MTEAIAQYEKHQAIHAKIESAIESIEAIDHPLLKDQVEDAIYYLKILGANNYILGIG